MMKIHVQEDKLHLMNRACRDIISSISETVDDIYKQEVAMQKKNKDGHLPPLCAIAQEVTRDNRSPSAFPRETAAFQSYINLLSEDGEVEAQLELARWKESLLGISMNKMEERKKFLAACGENVGFLEEARTTKLAEMNELLSKSQAHYSDLLGKFLLFPLYILPLLENMPFDLSCFYLSFPRVGHCSMCKIMCIHTHTHMHVCVYIYIYIYTHTYVHTHWCIFFILHTLFLPLHLVHFTLHICCRAQEYR